MTPSGSFRSCVGDVLAELEVRDVGLDLDRDAVGQAAHGDRAVDEAEHAALGDAGGLAGRDERDLDVDRLVELHLDEVDVLERRA